MNRTKLSRVGRREFRRRLIDTRSTSPEAAPKPQLAPKYDTLGRPLDTAGRRIPGPTLKPITEGAPVWAAVISTIDAQGPEIGRFEVDLSDIAAGLSHAISLWRGECALLGEELENGDVCLQIVWKSPGPPDKLRVPLQQAMEEKIQADWPDKNTIFHQCTCSECEGRRALNESKGMVMQ